MKTQETSIYKVKTNAGHEIVIKSDKIHDIQSVIDKFNKTVKDHNEQVETNIFNERLVVSYSITSIELIAHSFIE